MSVAAHLGIPLDEYDARIRTFIPGYEQMLDAAAQALRALAAAAPAIVDLGTGTGALAARCLDVRTDARLVGIDADPGILEAARRRLAARAAVASFVQGSFLDSPIPNADAIVASLSLHHVRTRERKRQLYGACRTALAANGLLVTADCFPSSDARLAELERGAWRAHLRCAYSDAETDAYFAAWAEEDVYVPLEDELAMLRDAGFVADVPWRRAPFGVIVARAR
jgi:ubiquinone/menaquinone biosynthesis C-methylase UbiE